MDRSDLQELHYIVHRDNLSSLCTHGILCHEDAKKIKHKSVAMSVIQNLRAKRAVPNGLPLHKYANLYINARNKMMFSRREICDELLVARISLDVLDLPGTVISDQNASSSYARFFPSPGGLKEIDKDVVFAEYWTHADERLQYWHGSAICAEVLVPHKVNPEHLLGFYVSCDEMVLNCEIISSPLPIVINKRLFFRV